MKTWIASLIALMTLSTAMVPAQAYDGSYFQRHPYQKNAAIGGGIGAAGGALLSHHGHKGRGALKGAAIGAGAGAGYTYLKRRF